MIFEKNNAQKLRLRCEQGLSIGWGYFNNEDRRARRKEARVAILGIYE